MRCGLVDRRNKRIGGTESGKDSIISSLCVAVNNWQNQLNEIENCLQKPGFCTQNYKTGNVEEKGSFNLFYDMEGKVIKEVLFSQRGKGTFMVYGENLEKGIYTYALVANEKKVVATGKMIKQ